MKLHRISVKRLGAGVALLSVLGATGAWAVHAQNAAVSVYSVASDGDVGEDAIRAAIDPLFEDGAMGDTRVLVVMHRGRIVAERYAPGFGAETKLLSWSIAKSVTAVLVGLMVSDGRLGLDSPVPVEAWGQPGDPRGRITLRQLLTMTSGLDHVEETKPVERGDTARMLFTDGAQDMAAYAEAKPLAHAPGSTFSYSTGSTTILAELMARMLTNSRDPDARRRAMQTFIDGRLKTPARLESLTMEYDAAGTMIGGSFLHMTGRDYARFGELLRNRGRSPNGHQIVPEKWIDFMRRPSPRNPAYGAHLWRNRASGESALMPGIAPDSLFGCVGHNGQYILVSPGQKLTVVRIGMSPRKEQREALKEGLARLMALFPG
ncbi:CubicO group peptidase (beta-lactamase class C family) [Sphingobium wenxiniae]|uniref:CubicO group peptidase (Beta-lactamase class C family) n=1 Tax=Sphingobium wenxiniae (strain DSM 21828 / CGMCC 1.7748 / JZ-1) TaxID=595605 RepID=A0A562KCU5_SPHWJ|nr:MULTISPECIES: serine hydrolase [Sphingobium]MBB6191470.1 CubicO group peptidase (beta-lactamase class C family) [Sphingobium wenxiniae]TWH93238.1 CubicO group peptidase (beta-lactamase class C family) [Sphingobium wenxiniae]WRD76216.1 serine hydrolase [Sphingobium baderi]